MNTEIYVSFNVLKLIPIENMYIAICAFQNDKITKIKNAKCLKSKIAKLT